MGLAFSKAGRGRVKMLADRSDEDHDSPMGGGANEGLGGSIRDPEIVQIAVFKLRECAARLETLASAGQQSLGKELHQIADELRRMEIALLRQAREDS
jgi:hypothetical protein